MSGKVLVSVPKLATVSSVVDTVKKDQSICDVYKCQFVDTDGRLHNGHLKRISRLKIFNELICSHIGREVIQLPIPDCYLGSLDTSLLPDKVNDESSLKIERVFISKTIPFADYNTLPHPLKDVAIYDWDNLATAAVYDGLVANKDRHYDNILFDRATSRFWLIDYESALSGGLNTDILDFEQPSFDNKLLGLVKNAARSDFSEIREVSAQIRDRMIRADYLNCGYRIQQILQLRKERVESALTFIQNRAWHLDRLLSQGLQNQQQIRLP